MHPQIRLWFSGLKVLFPTYFENKKVLEVGSYDCNGSLRSEFSNCEYTGIDVAPGNGVDKVSVCHQYEADPGSFDVVFSTSALEHDMFFPLTLMKMHELTKVGGLLFFQADSEWGIHGTKDVHPNTSLTSGMDNNWSEYYRNIKPQDITAVWNLNMMFSPWRLEYFHGLDLNFFGIKK